MVKGQNLILIGMPGAGKSNVGVLLAKRLGVSFTDTDILMKHRLGSLDERGVLRMPGQTIDVLYEKRRPLYQKYADIIVSSSGATADQVVTKLLRRLQVSR